MMMMKSYASLLYVWLPALLLSTTQKTLGHIAPCENFHAHVFLPFTTDGKEHPHFYGKRRNNLGFSHLAAIMIAVRHLIERNSTIVPEIADPIFQDCDVDFASERSIAFDSGTDSQSAVIDALSVIFEQGPPCAMIGPYHDLPAEALSSLATSLQVPLMVHRGLNSRLTYSYFHPFTNLLHPSKFATSGTLLRFLLDTGRTDFVAILTITSDSTIQEEIFLENALTFDYQFEIKIKTFTITPLTDGFLPGPIDIRQTGVSRAIAGIKKSGYRTVVVLSEFESLKRMLPVIADEVNAQGLNQGGHFWIFNGGIDLHALEDPNFFPNNTNVRKFFSGAAFITPLDGFVANGSNDKFLQAWRTASPDILQLAKAANPIQPGQPGYYEPGDDYFATVDPEVGASYIYDAVIASGLGGCLAESMNLTLSGPTYLDLVRSLTFTGASGPVAFLDNRQSPGTRNSQTIVSGVYNLYPPTKPNVNFTLTDILRFRDDAEDFGDAVHTSKFTSIEPFIYADGSTNPPELLRDTPEQNYIGDGVRNTAFVLFSITASLLIAAIIWISIYREHRVLRASQPLLLISVFIGSLISLLAIPLGSFDESHGLDDDQLDRLCVALPWVVCIGHIITYGMIFARLWRVNKVLQFSRTTIKVEHVTWPIRIMLALAVVVLIIGTIVSPTEFVRTVANEETGESFGECAAREASWWLGVVAILMGIPTVLTFVMSWKTKDVDSAFSDAWWVFLLLLIQFQTLLLALPIAIILRNVSTDGRHLGFTLMLWSFPTGVVTLLMFPKLKAFYFPNQPTAVRGVVGQVRVSGMANNASSLGAAHNSAVSHESRMSSTSAGVATTTTATGLHHEYGDGSKFSNNNNNESAI